MATLINNQSANFTSATAWSVVDPTSYQNSEAGNTASTASWVASTAFVPGAITIDAIGAKFLAHNSTGNIGVRLGKQGSITAVSVANPGVFTTGAAHGLTTGETILITGTVTTPATTALAWVVTVINATQFSLVQSTGAALNITAVTTGTGTWATPLAMITANTLVAAPVFTTSVAHGLAVGSQITIKGSTSTPSYNGTFTVATVPSTTTFTLTGAASAVGGVSGAAFYNITAVPDNVCVIAANDLQTVNTATNTGWAQFKLPSSITLTAAATYTFQIAGTSAGNATPYRTATAGDWSRLLRTTTVQALNQTTKTGTITSNTLANPTVVTTSAAHGLVTGDYVTFTGSNSTPALTGPYVVTVTGANTFTVPVNVTTAGTAGTFTSGDNILVSGDYTGVGTNNTYTITMDNTSTTNWGDVEVNGKSILQYGSAAATNYYLKTNVALNIYTGGTFTMGTTSVPIPSTSTAKLELVNAVNVGNGLEIRSGAVFNSQGAVITNSAFLAADAAAAATSLTTNVSTGWKNGDVIALGATTQTRAQCETKALTANASGTTLTIAALTNAHGGTGGTLAELINLTRNVQIFGTSTALQAYINIGAFATVDFESTEIYNMGSATALKRGIDIGTTTGTFIMNNCSLHDFVVASSIVLNANSATNNNITISNTNFYNASIGLTTSNTTGTNISYSNMIGMFCGSYCFSFANLSGTIANLYAVGGAANGISMTHNLTAANVVGSISGLSSHSNTGLGIAFSGISSYGNNPYLTVTNISAWRNTTYGLGFATTFGLMVDGAGSLGGAVFGNATANIGITGQVANNYLKNLVVNAGTTLVSPIGFAISANDGKEFYLDNCTFGVTTAHATGDISWTVANLYGRYIASNCIFNSGTIVANMLANAIDTSEIVSARHQQTAGNHRSFRKFGTISPDTTIFRNGSPSTRLTPNTTNQKINSGYKKIAVPNGQTAIVNVYLRKSVAGDGSAYNGNQPRLMLRADPAAGINSDTVLATATNAANGAFQLLTGNIPTVNDNCAVTVYIDSDGTAGWVNIDDWYVG